MKKIHRLALLFLVGVFALFTACSSDDEKTDSQPIADGDVSEAETDENADPPATDGDEESAEEGEAEEQAAVVQCWDDLPIGEKEIFAEGLEGSEGIAFSKEGALWAVVGDAVHRFNPDGTSEARFAAETAVGIAFRGDSLFVAKLGESMDNETNDGEILKIDNYQTPETAQETAISGIPSPNFITVMPTGGILVSDDFARTIWRIDEGGQPEIWSNDVISPNGMVFTEDGDALWTVSTFNLDDEVANGLVWRVGVDENGNAGEAESFDISSACGSSCLLDGVALDAEGALYVAANVAGKLFRVDESGQAELVADGMLGIASLAFGQGEDYDPCSIYATTLLSDKIWRISIGKASATLFGVE